jgi:hypothetical protein
MIIKNPVTNEHGFEPKLIWLTSPEIVPTTTISKLPPYRQRMKALLCNTSSYKNDEVERTKNY